MLNLKDKSQANSQSSQLKRIVSKGFLCFKVNCAIFIYFDSFDCIL